MERMVNESLRDGMRAVLEMVSSRRHMTEAACDLELESQDRVRGDVRQAMMGWKEICLRE